MKAKVRIWIVAVLYDSAEGLIRCSEMLGTAIAADKDKIGVTGNGDLTFETDGLLTVPFRDECIFSQMGISIIGNILHKQSVCMTTAPNPSAQFRYLLYFFRDIALHFSGSPRVLPYIAEYIHTATDGTNSINKRLPDFRLEIRQSYYWKRIIILRSVTSQSAQG